MIIADRVLPGRVRGHDGRAVPDPGGGEPGAQGQEGRQGWQEVTRGLLGSEAVVMGRLPTRQSLGITSDFFKDRLASVGSAN